MSIETLRSLYSKGLLTPDSVIKEVYKRLSLPGADPAVWLHVIPEEASIALAQELLKKFPDPAARPPLFGIPFSIKDSIDIEGLPTTGACPAFAYTAEKDAPSYALLIEAGAIPIGKVNLVCAVFRYSLTRVKLTTPATRINLLQELWACAHRTANLHPSSRKIIFQEAQAQARASAWQASRFRSRWLRIPQAPAEYQRRSTILSDSNRLGERCVLINSPLGICTFKPL